jgi:hypothetical protein
MMCDIIYIPVIPVIPVNPVIPVIPVSVVPVAEDLHDVSKNYLDRKTSFSYMKNIYVMNSCLRVSPV